MYALKTFHIGFVSRGVDGRVVFRSWVPLVKTRPRTVTRRINLLGRITAAVAAPPQAAGGGRKQADSRMLQLAALGPLLAMPALEAWVEGVGRVEDEFDRLNFALSDTD